MPRILGNGLGDKNVHKSLFLSSHVELFFDIIC